METETIKKAVLILSENKAANIRAIDVRKQVGLTDAFIMASSQSKTHLKFLFRELIEQLKKTFQREPVSSEGTAEAGWILIDYGDFITHIFSEDKRNYYRLDALWGDAPVILEED